MISALKRYTYITAIILRFLAKCLKIRRNLRLENMNKCVVHGRYWLGVPGFRCCAIGILEDSLYMVVSGLKRLGRNILMTAGMLVVVWLVLDRSVVVFGVRRRCLFLFFCVVLLYNSDYVLFLMMLVIGSMWCFQGLLKTVNAVNVSNGY